MSDNFTPIRFVVAEEMKSGDQVAVRGGMGWELQTVEGTRRTSYGWTMVDVVSEGMPHSFRVGSDEILPIVPRKEMPADRIPEVMSGWCDYCRRYNRPCGRHEN